MTPLQAEQSSTKDGDEMKNAAVNSIDLDLATVAGIVAGQDGSRWLKVRLGNQHCVQKVMWYYNNGKLARTWTCSATDCSKCDGLRYCNSYIVTVISEITSTDSLTPVSDCKYGDTVKILYKDTGAFQIAEVAITGTKGEARYSKSFRTGEKIFRD